MNSSRRHRLCRSAWVNRRYNDTKLIKPSLIEVMDIYSYCFTTSWYNVKLFRNSVQNIKAYTSMSQCTVNCWRLSNALYVVELSNNYI